MELFQHLDLSSLRVDWTLLLLPLPFFAAMAIDAFAWKGFMPESVNIALADLFAPQDDQARDEHG